MREKHIPRLIKIADTWKNPTVIWDREISAFDGGR